MKTVDKTVRKKQRRRVITEERRTLQPRSTPPPPEDLILESDPVAAKMLDLIRGVLHSLTKSAVAAQVSARDFAKIAGNEIRPFVEESIREGYATPLEGLADLLELEGGCVDVAHARYLFRKPHPVTRQTISDRIGRGELIAYKTGSGQFMLPRWQFRPQGGLLEGLSDVLKAIRETIPGAGDLTPFAFFLQEDPVTGGRTPLEALKAGDVKQVLDAVAARVA